MNVNQRTGQRYVNKNVQNNRNRGNVKKNFNRPAGQGQVQVNGVRPRGARDAIIRQNLAHMKEVAQKKRVAQEKYYGNGRSPMIRTSSGPFKQEKKFSVQNRLSVQQRLGNKGTNTPKFINPNNTYKKPVYVNIKPNTNKIRMGGMQSDKIIRVQNMTQHKGARFGNQNGPIKTINSAGKVVFLQQVRRQPNNYTVRVNNDRNRKHHVNKGLNPYLQQEIKMIQNKSSRQIMTSIAPPAQPVQNITNTYEVDRLPIVATSRTLHERFSLI